MRMGGTCRDAAVSECACAAVAAASTTGCVASSIWLSNCTRLTLPRMLTSSCVNSVAHCAAHGVARQPRGATRFCGLHCTLGHSRRCSMQFVHGCWAAVQGKLKLLTQSPGAPQTQACEVLAQLPSSAGTPAAAAAVAGSGGSSSSSSSSRCAGCLDAVQGQVEELVLQAAHDGDAQAVQTHVHVHALPPHHLALPLQPQQHLRAVWQGVRWAAQLGVCSAGLAAWARSAQTCPRATWRSHCSRSSTCAPCGRASDGQPSWVSDRRAWLLGHVPHRRAPAPPGAPTAAAAAPARRVAGDELCSWAPDWWA